MERVEEMGNVRTKKRKEVPGSDAKMVQPEEKETEEKIDASEKEYSRWEWFLYIILIPSLFTVIMVSVILSFFHINIWEMAKGAAMQIPYVQQILDPKKPPEKGISLEEQLKTQLGETKAALDKAMAALNQAKAKTATQEQQIASLQQQLDTAIKDGQQAKATDEERKQKAAEMARLFTGMNTSNAASVLDQLSLHESVLILSQMQQTDRSSILAKLDPVKSAQLISLLNNTPYSADLDRAALQERIDLLAKELDQANYKLTALSGGKGGANTAAARELVDTLTRMTPDAAAQVIKKMWLNSERERVLQLIPLIDPKVKASIFSALVNENAASGNPSQTGADKKTGRDVAAEINAALLK